MAKIFSEQETRWRLLNTARQLGCEINFWRIMNRTDILLKSCTNEVERQHIIASSCIELHQMLGAAGTLEIDGKKVY